MKSLLIVENVFLLKKYPRQTTTKNTKEIHGIEGLAL
jgi:hypothetical protein